MADEPIKVSEDSSISIPLRNLISLLGAVASAVWGYSALDNRITTLENEVRSINERVVQLQQANRDAATGIDPWATDVEQSTRIQRVESDVKRIEELYLQKHKD
jgi:uncharacterized protein YlxW (UPF0749 family)